MTFFDFFVLALLGASVAAGAVRGLVRAALTLAALVVGLLLAARVYETAGAVLRGVGLFESEGASQAAGFLLVFGVVLALGFAAGVLVRGRMRRAKLGWLDRVLGGAFGLARGIAVCSVIYLALTA
ncbi:MAG TPA: CvpA family protein, partial [Pyrinomonadaceae bacterium]|nr:CvpA family protein [Pyrinomonadaceae bacterium]